MRFVPHHILQLLGLLELVGACLDKFMVLTEVGCGEQSEPHQLCSDQCLCD